MLTCTICISAAQDFEKMYSYVFFCAEAVEHFAQVHTYGCDPLIMGPTHSSTMKTTLRFLRIQDS